MVVLSGNPVMFTLWMRFDLYGPYVYDSEDPVAATVSDDGSRPQCATEGAVRSAVSQRTARSGARRGGGAPWLKADARAPIPNGVSPRSGSTPPLSHARHTMGGRGGDWLLTGAVACRTESLPSTRRGPNPTRAPDAKWSASLYHDPSALVDAGGRSLHLEALAAEAPPTKVRRVWRP